MKHDTDEATRQINKALTLQMMDLHAANKTYREDLEIIEPIVAGAKANGMKTCPISILASLIEVSKSMNLIIDALLDVIELTKHTSSLREFQSVMNQTLRDE